MNHVTIAASGKAFGKLFDTVVANFSLAKSDSKNFGPFTASYDIKLHLDDGSLTLNDDNSLEVQNMHVVWDTLKAQICFALPQICVGGWCIVPDPWNGCLVSLPKICIGGNQICAGLDLSGLVSEIHDVKANLAPKYYIDPARVPGESDLDAEYANHPNKWKIFINPIWVHVDLIDVPDTVANVLENAVHNAIEDILWFLPGWAVDLIWAIIGPIIDFIVDVIGIIGDIADWVADLLGNQFDLLGIIETAVADYFASKYPIYDFEDPYPILAKSGALIPVKIPIRNLTAVVNSKEMTVLGDVGA
jgi:hypothetical protein